MNRYKKLTKYLLSYLGYYIFMKSNSCIVNSSANKFLCIVINSVQLLQSKLVLWDQHHLKIRNYILHLLRILSSYHYQYVILKMDLSKNVPVTGTFPSIYDICFLRTFYLTGHSASTINHFCHKIYGFFFFIFWHKQINDKCRGHFPKQSSICSFQ